jgi:hypothetical protein
MLHAAWLVPDIAYSFLWFITGEWKSEIWGSHMDDSEENYLLGRDIRQSSVYWHSGGTCTSKQQAVALKMEAVCRLMISSQKIVLSRLKEIIPYDQSIWKICIPRLQSCNRRKISLVYTKCPRLWKAVCISSNCFRDMNRLNYGSASSHLSHTETTGLKMCSFL